MLYFWMLVCCDVPPGFLIKNILASKTFLDNQLHLKDHAGTKAPNLSSIFFTAGV